jgi:ketosteroid isomerase-like protein
MVKKSQHVVPFGNGWAVVAAGRKSVSVIATRQSDAILYATGIAKKQKTEVVIHGRDGKIRSRNSYSNRTNTTSTL